jgi:integrase
VEVMLLRGRPKQGDRGNRAGTQERRDPRHLGGGDQLGRGWYPDSISERFDRLVGAAGLPRIRLHDTRHTAATLMLSGGTPVPVVAAILGDDPAVVLRTYAHAIPSDVDAAGAALSAALLG